MKRKAGFTLIELVVAIVMACILLATLTPLLTLAQNGTYTAQRSTRVTQAGDAIYEYVASLLKNAERVYIGDGSTHQPADPAAWNKLTVSADRKNGLLTVNGTPVYPLEYQEGCALALGVTAQSRDKLTLSISLEDNRSADPLYSKQSAFTLAGLEGGGFGQTEGLVGAPLSVDGFGGPQTAPELAGVGPLVIYFKGSGSLIPNFNPTPGGDHTEPTPGPSVLSVVLPSRLEVEVSKDAFLKAIATWPEAAENKKVEWSFPAQAGSYFAHTPAITMDPDGLVQQLNGLQPTTGPIKATVTVHCTVGGAVQTSSASCQISVWQGQGELMIKAGTSWNNNAPDLNNTTVFYQKGDQIELGAYALNVAGQNPLLGNWKSSNVKVLRDFNSSSVGWKDAFYSAEASAVGVATLTFTANGKAPGGVDAGAVKGKTAAVTIVVYDPADITFSLSFQRTGSVFSSAYFTSGGAADRVVCKVYVNPALDPSFRETFVNALRECSVQLATGDQNNPWRAYDSWLAQPAPVKLHSPLDANAVYDLECTIPLHFREMSIWDNSNDTPNIGLALLNSGNAIVIPYQKASLAGGTLTFTAYAKRGALKLTEGNVQNGPDIRGQVLEVAPNDNVVLAAWATDGTSWQAFRGNWSYDAFLSSQPPGVGPLNNQHSINVSVPSGALPGDVYQFRVADSNGNTAFVTLKVVAPKDSGYGTLTDLEQSVGGNNIPVTGIVELVGHQPWEGTNIIYNPTTQFKWGTAQWAIRCQGKTSWSPLPSASEGIFDEQLLYTLNSGDASIQVRKSTADSHGVYELLLTFLTDPDEKRQIRGPVTVILK